MRRFVTVMARREGRAAFRRLGVYMASIAIGVAALVALHSLRSDVVRSIERESLSLLGGDVRLSANRPLPDSVLVWVDSLRAEGAETAAFTGLISMALAETSGITRLVQIGGVEEGYPFYGNVQTSPPGLWGAIPEAAVLVDPALLIQFDVVVGDSLALGQAQFRIAGTVEGLPTDIGIQSAVGPRVFMADDQLDTTGLVTFGSLVRYRLFLKLPPGTDTGELRHEHTELIRETQVSFRTASEQANSLTTSAEVLGDFMGLVGLAALLLGGVGVGSAVNVYVRSKLTSVAVLRCLGATRNAVFSIYVLQAAWLGLAGSALGVVIGLIVQRFLPALVSGLLPVTLDSVPSLSAIVFGILLGTWVAIVFALLPLLEVRDVPPLAALRQGVQGETPGQGPRRLVLATLLATVLGLTVIEAPTPMIGAFFALGLGAAALLLILVAKGLMALLRTHFPSWPPYTVRQGVGNLFRPENQTVAVVLALGFGVLVVGVIAQLESNISRELSLESGPDSPNLLLFDIQANQEVGVDSLLREYGASGTSLTPVVLSRIASIDGIPTRDLLADSTGDGPPRWTLRREYRNTFRVALKESEILTSGDWWEADQPRTEGQLPRISVEVDLAEDLRIGLGSRITWLVGGREVETVVSSLREVDWARFDTNFFVVFEPGIVEDVPRTSMAVAKVDTEQGRNDLQRALVRAYPNVSVLDLSTVRETLESILAQARGAISLLGGLCTLAGLVVMAGAIASTRAQRRREGALLRTVGARLRQMRQIVVSEYVALGSLAAFSGGVLALAAGFLLTWGLFDMSFEPDWPAALWIWVGTVVLTVLTGVFTGEGRGALSPLEVLRQTVE